MCRRRGRPRPRGNGGRKFLEKNDFYLAWKYLNVWLVKAPSALNSAGSALGIALTSVAAAYLGNVTGTRAWVTPAVVFGEGAMMGLSGVLVNRFSELWNQRAVARAHLADALHNEHLTAAAAEALRLALLAAGPALQAAGKRVTQADLAHLAEASTRVWVALSQVRDERLAPYEEERIAEQLFHHLSGTGKAHAITVATWKELLQEVARKGNVDLELSPAAWDALAAQVAGDFPTRLYNAFKSDLAAGGAAFAGVMLRSLAEIHKTVLEVATSAPGVGGRDPGLRPAAAKHLVKQLGRLAEGIRRDTTGLEARIDAATRRALQEFTQPLSEALRGQRRREPLVLGLSMAMVAGLCFLGFLLVGHAKREEERSTELPAAVAEAMVPELQRMKEQMLVDVTAEFKRELDKRTANLEARVERADSEEERVSGVAELAAVVAQGERAPAVAADILARAGRNLLSAEMAEILAERGIDAALAHYQARRAQNKAEALADLRQRRDPDLTAAKLLAITGRHEEARAAVAELVALDPDWPEAATAYAWLLRDESIRAMTHGSLAQAWADIDSARQWVERVEKARPGEAETQRLVVAIEHQLGDVRLTRGQAEDREEARKHYERSLKLVEQLLRDNPGSAVAQRDVAVSSSKLGDFLRRRRQTGDREAAWTHYQRSLDLRKQLFEANPEAPWAQLDMLASFEQLGTFMASRGQVGDEDVALDYLNQSHKLAEQMRLANPQSSAARWNVLRSLNVLGYFLLQRGLAEDVEAARRHINRSLALAEQSWKDNPKSTQARQDLSASLQLLGDVLVKRGQAGDFEEARGMYERSLKLREQLSQENPGVGEAHRRVWLSLIQLGDLAAKRGQAGDSEAATNYYERALAMDEQLLQINPGEAEVVSCVATVRYKLGQLAFGQGRADESARHRLAIYLVVRTALDRGAELSPYLLKLYQVLDAEFRNAE